MAWFRRQTSAGDRAAGKAVGRLGLFERVSQRFARKDNRFPSGVSMRKVFVLPRRHGLMVGFSTLGVFAIAIRIQNNMLLLIAVALFILFLLSLVWAGRNLAGVKLRVQEGQRLIAGQAQKVMITITADRPKHFVVVKIGADKTRLDLRNRAASVPMTVKIDTRGRMRIPPLLIESDFPFGLARCWAWLSPGSILVAPSPLSASGMEARAVTKAGQSEEDEEASGADSLAEWVNGTPQTRIHWKRFAATGRLLIKTGDHVAGDRVIIDYARLKAMGHERALSMMCGAALAAEHQQTPFVMILPGHEVKSPSGDAGEALDALALA